MSRIWLEGKIRLEELPRKHPLQYEELLADGGSTLSGKESKNPKRKKLSEVRKMKSKWKQD